MTSPGLRMSNLTSASDGLKRPRNFKTFVRPRKWAHGNGRVKRGCHVKYELSSPPRTPSKCSLKYISAVCLLFLLTKVIFSKEATPTHFKFFSMRQPHFCHFWTFLLLNLKPLFARLWGQLQPKLWGYTFCFSDIVLSMAISPHKHKLKSQSSGIVP